jgi:hypothetical protein
MSPEAHELALYLDNDEPLYRQKMYVFRALAKKKDRGVYDPKLAPLAFVALLNAAAKKYIKEFGGPGDRWNLMFSPMARRHAALHFAQEFVGWYDVDYESPKKRPRTPPAGQG